MGGGVNPVKEEQSDLNVATRSMILFKGMFKSATDIGVWLLIWGFIYALAFAFGVPLFP